MRQIVKKLFCDEEGAVTIDWVVLTAAITGLAFAVIYSMANGSETLADSLSGNLTSLPVAVGD
ncbi:hypothetical protein ACMU_04065 [Actibacterium mucosum KCTC 23349]|uniref:Pilus assembly protein n=1 Tax=Actibacterium mucosum KCTC 23349 TaxID=1454373 RepID=A0A037ZC61_9RHOB|nr:hypothetical protein [Actibacterium mucosum]KAJ54079.1 hypothetical protein ACMU_04065 [Actibacterium mucosum KCTC 23349]